MFPQETKNSLPASSSMSLPLTSFSAFFPLCVTQSILLVSPCSVHCFPSFLLSLLLVHWTSLSLFTPDSASSSSVFPQPSNGLLLSLPTPGRIGSTFKCKNTQKKTVCTSQINSIHTLLQPQNLNPVPFSWMQILQQSSSPPQQP